jgi:hypothetical protein
VSAPSIVRGRKEPFSTDRLRLRKKKWDDQPTQSASVLIASSGEPIPPSAVRWALALSGGDAVAVISLARIYGSSFGLPNPGLMPTKKELQDQRSQVDKAVRLIERSGSEGWGQVAATRRPVKAIAQAARARGARHVIVVAPETARWRQFVEGNLAKDVARRLGSEVRVESMAP